MTMSSGADSRCVLVFDEDPEMRSLLSGILSASGVRTLIAGHKTEGARHLSLSPVDLVVADTKVSDLSALELIRFYREVSVCAHRPSFLFLADPTESGPVSQLAGEGGVRVLRRPFERSEFLSCVRTMLDGIAPDRDSPSGSIRVDVPNSDVYVGGVRVSLTASEFRLLRELVENPGRILSRDHLIQKVQGEGIVVVDRAIDTHVFSLRKKLGSAGAVIETVRGEGYRFRESGDRESGENRFE